jgi:hypothetical protein
MPFGCLVRGKRKWPTGDELAVMKWAMLVRLQPVTMCVEHRMRGSPFQAGGRDFGLQNAPHSRERRASAWIPSDVTSGCHRLSPPCHPGVFSSAGHKVLFGTVRAGAKNPDSSFPLM